MLIVYVTMVLLVCGEACWYFPNVSFLNDFPFWNGTILFRQKFSISLLKIVLVLGEMALKLFLICFVELAPLAWHLREGNHLSFIVKFKSIYSNLLLFVDSYSLLLWIVNLWFSPLFVLTVRAKHIYGYEVVAQAISDARRNAEQNGIHNATFIQGDLNKVSDNFGKEFPQPDIVISGHFLVAVVFIKQPA